MVSCLSSRRVILEKCDFAAVVEASSSSRLISFGATGVSRNKSLELS